MKRLRWETGVFRVSTPDGYRGRYGHIAIGASLAVHKTANGWTITHTWTGYAILKQVTSLREAKAIVAKIARLDWNFTRPDDARLPFLARAVEKILAKDHGGEAA